MALHDKWIPGMEGNRLRIIGCDILDENIKVAYLIELEGRRWDISQL